MTVSAISGDTAESGTSATFSVVLTSQPSADVTIPILSLDTSEGTVDQASLTFTGANWNTAQTVTVTGVDDALVDGDITYTVEVGDPAGGDYDALTNADTADVSVTNYRRRQAAVTVSAISGDTAESGTSGHLLGGAHQRAERRCHDPDPQPGYQRRHGGSGQPDLYQRQLGYGPDRDGHRRRRRPRRR